MDVDVVWGTIVDELRRLAPVEVGRSHLSPKPAVFLHGREIAHWDGPGAMDLRVTQSAWAVLSSDFAADPAVRQNPGRRDWIEINPTGDITRLFPLVAAAIAANDG